MNGQHPTGEEARRWAEVLRLASSFKVDVKYWRKDGLTSEEQVRERSQALPYILVTMQMLRVLGCRSMVEIGTLRHEMLPECQLAALRRVEEVVPRACCTDGHSTYFWASVGLEVHSVDVDPACRGALERTYRNLREPFPANLRLHVPCDGLEFLRSYTGQIDFLYLDGWDKGSEGYAERHLEAYLLARPRLSASHLISIDDTDFATEEGGKESMLLPRLLEDGYVPLVKGRQTVVGQVESLLKRL